MCYVLSWFLKEYNYKKYLQQYFHVSSRNTVPGGLPLCERAAAFLAAAVGQPDKDLCVLRLELTWPRPLHPGVGHFKIVSCNAKTV